MERQEKVGIALIGNISTPCQSYENIGLTRINHTDIGTIILNIAPKSKRIFQCKVFFFGVTTRCSVVSSTVSGINNECKLAVCRHDSNSKQQHCYQEEDSLSTHKTNISGDKVNEKMS